MQGQPKTSVQTIHLKGMALQPEFLKCPAKTTIVIKITNNHSCSFESKDRKFIFLMEETDEESPPLTSNQQYQFSLPLQSPGTYNLQCVNYTKIRCTIQVEGQEEEKEEHVPKVTDIIRAPSPLCNLSQVKEERDEQVKEGNAVEEEEKNTNSKSEFADYERMLNEQDMQYDYMPNKYLQYFKEQFKLWRDFFETPSEGAKQNSAKKQQPKEGVSSGSLSLSQRQSQKEESVISHLRSQQEMSQIQEEEINRNKIMKKTNSQYCLNVERQTDKAHPSDSKRKQINTNTSSPNPRTEQSEADSFVDWAWSWADQQKLGEVNISRLGDRHLVSQWLVFLQNKFKISELMYV